MVSIHRPLSYEPNTLTTAPLRSTDRTAALRHIKYPSKGFLKMSGVGFEPTRIASPDLESGAFDRSAKLTCAARCERLTSFFAGGGRNVFCMQHSDT